MTWFHDYIIILTYFTQKIKNKPCREEKLSCEIWWCRTLWLLLCCMDVIWFNKHTKCLLEWSFPLLSRPIKMWIPDAVIIHSSHVCTGNYSGGYNGDKNGYAVPAGTDIFISVSGSLHWKCLVLSVFNCNDNGIDSFYVKLIPLSLFHLALDSLFSMASTFLACICSFNFCKLVAIGLQSPQISILLG